MLLACCPAYIKYIAVGVLLKTCKCAWKMDVKKIACRCVFLCASTVKFDNETFGIVGCRLETWSRSGRGVSS